MPRPKGSKNKAKTSSIPTADFTSLIAEKAAAKDALVSDIATLEENLANIKADLKAKKAELKKLDTELGKLEETIQKLMADGVSAAEILEKLK